MNAYTFAVRSEQANARIVAAAKRIAPEHGAESEAARLEAVSHKDPLEAQVLRLEAVAGLLERVSPPPIPIKPEPEQDDLGQPEAGFSEPEPIAPVSAQAARSVASRKKHK